MHFFFFERVIWPESDLDVFVKEGQSELLSDYLVKHESYRQVGDTMPNERYASYGVQQVLKNRRKRDPYPISMLNSNMMELEAENEI